MNFHRVDGLTTKQRTLLLALQADERQTLRQLSAATRITSTSVVRYNLRVLAVLGYVESPPHGWARSYRLTDKGRAYQVQER
jgi:DNA-binding MarR family transcriptional regulator